MRPLVISEAPTIAVALQDEIRRSAESRYDHRLHGVLLVAQGMTCPEVARFLGDAPRTVEYWVHRFEERGLAGLIEGTRPGRPRRLDDDQLKEISIAIRQPPADLGLTTNLWDGKTLAAFIEQRYNVTLSVRQCQRMFRQLGFRLRKPRSVIAHADPEAQQAYKKTPSAGEQWRD